MPAQPRGAEAPSIGTRHSGRGRARHRRCVRISCHVRRFLHPVAAANHQARQYADQNRTPEGRPGGARQSDNGAERDGRTTRSASGAAGRSPGRQSPAARDYDDPGHFQRSSRADAGWSADRIAARDVAGRAKWWRTAYGAARPAQRPRLGGAGLWQQAGTHSHHQAAAGARRRCRANRPASAAHPLKPHQPTTRPVREPRTASAGGPLSIVPGGESAPQAPPPRTRTATAHTGGPMPLSSSPAAEPAPARGGGYAVQVSSQRSEAEAQTAFRSLQAKFPRELGSHHAESPPRRPWRQRRLLPRPGRSVCLRRTGLEPVQ